jgi:hypothetical protein
VKVDPRAIISALPSSSSSGTHKQKYPHLPALLILLLLSTPQEPAKTGLSFPMILLAMPLQVEVALEHHSSSSEAVPEK